MYTPKAKGQTALLWFISGLGWTGNWSVFEHQRRGSICEMLPFISISRNPEGESSLDMPGHKRRDGHNRVIYLN